MKGGLTSQPDVAQTSESSLGSCGTGPISEPLRRIGLQYGSQGAVGVYGRDLVTVSIVIQFNYCTVKSGLQMIFVAEENTARASTVSKPAQHAKDGRPMDNVRVYDTHL